MYTKKSNVIMLFYGQITQIILYLWWMLKLEQRSAFCREHTNNIVPCPRSIYLSISGHCPKPSEQNKNDKKAEKRCAICLRNKNILKTFNWQLNSTALTFNETFGFFYIFRELSKTFLNLLNLVHTITTAPSPCKMKKACINYLLLQPV